MSFGFLREGDWACLNSTTRQLYSSFHYTSALDKKHSTYCHNSCHHYRPVQTVYLKNRGATRLRHWRSACFRFFFLMGEKFPLSNFARVFNGGLEHALHMGPDSHSQALLAVGQSFKTSVAPDVPKTGKGRAVFKILPKLIRATLVGHVMGYHRYSNAGPG